MATDATLIYDAASVIKNLTEELSFLRSEVRLLRNSLSSLHKEDKVTEVQEWLTLEQLMTYIPGSPSIPTLRRWIKQDGLPAQKVKRKLVFLKSGIDEWLRKRSVASDFEIEQKAHDYLKSTIKTPYTPMAAEEISFMTPVLTPKNSEFELILPESKGKINSIFIIFVKSINNQSNTII